MDLMKTYVHDPILHDSFQNGTLREQWAASYPFLFDDLDMKVAIHQPLYHYFEWQAAVYIYEELGLLSLVEKYQFKKHKRQNEIFKSLVPDEVLQLIRSRKYGSQQMPDLFVFSPDRSSWFFCEVKGNRDKERPKQTEFFNELNKITNNPVRLIKFVD